MKKYFKSLLALTLLISSGLFIFPNGKAEAATSSWQSVTKISGCKVRVWTDYTIYTSNADTIDSYLESNGHCGRLEYEGMSAQQNENANFYSKNRFNGYFSNRTPIKRFNLDNFTGRFTGTTKGIYVNALVWKAGKKSTTATLVSSVPLTVYKR
ncbi:cell wall-binding protein [Heyndrickxia sporothermodurans]|uniref:cell wall-binding protein n=1 Tax=Heyndrickxia sporothermodurans TaxID=46224 RepID=UPI002E1A3CC0|nr:cell wall-binding protein [Heyndrickxia sporothermodurans]MED3696738.1 cell wall-binding protein [Heyndrickxia sporothermodurans]